MHFVVGLGNPGEQYANTPHNAGFRVVDRLAEMHAIRVTRPDSRALVGTGEIGGRSVMLAKPLTFMNLSGTSVKPLMEKHGIAVEDMIAVWDELNLPFGGLRILAKGSAGGHNGARSLIQSLGTSEFCRVRLGIHPGHPIHDGADFVLAQIRRGQQQEWEDLVGLAADAVTSIITEGVEKAMTRFNRRAQGCKEEE